MKVLIVNTVPTERNGITNVIFNYLSAIDSKEIEFGYVYKGQIDEDYEKYLRVKGIKCYQLRRSIKHPIRYIKELSKISKDYDIVHAHGNSSSLLLEMLAAKLGKAKVRIAHSHNTTCNSPLVHKILNPIFIKFCTERLACGVEAGKWLYGNHDFKVINNGIDTFRFRFNDRERENIRKQLRWSDSFIIGNVGNFYEQKNHTFLLDTFSRFYQKEPKSRLLILGDGPLKDELLIKVKNLGLEDTVKFAGSVGNVEVYLSAMDIIVMPSLFEGLPLTLIEEQANGLQCVVSDVITKDADMGNLEFLSLDLPASEWSKCIERKLKKLPNRLESSSKSIEIIKSRGFDIHEEAKKLTDIYLNA